MTTSAARPAATQPEEPTWRCDSCGVEYTADVGKCGQLQPPCDGTVRLVVPSPPPTDADVVGAIRLGLEAAADDRTAVAITRELLARTPATDPRATKPTELVIEAGKTIGSWELTDA